MIIKDVKLYFSELVVSELTLAAGQILVCPIKRQTDLNPLSALLQLMHSVCVVDLPGYVMAYSPQKAKQRGSS